MNDLSDTLPFMLTAFALPFVMASVLAVWQRGWQALNHTSEMLKSGRVNIGLAMINSVMIPTAYLYVTEVAQFLHLTGVWQVPAEAWLGVPIVLAILTWLVLVDFSDYCIHRVLHEPALWSFHAVHHSDEAMNFTTSFRMHIFELVLMRLMILTFAAWANVPIEAVLIAELIAGVYNKFVHMDVDVHFGPLNRVLATPRLHRWHHAMDPAAYGKNLANIFSLWDTLFGTYHCPGRYEGQTGLGADGPGTGVVGNLFWPVIVLARSARSQLASTPTTEPADAQSMMIQDV